MAHAQLLQLRCAVPAAAAPRRAVARGRPCSGRIRFACSSAESSPAESSAVAGASCVVLGVGQRGAACVEQLFRSERGRVTYCTIAESATENADVASGLVQIIQPLDGASGASELARRLESWRTEGMRSLVIVANLADSEIISSVSNDVASQCGDALVASVVAKPFTFEGTRKSAAAGRTLKAIWGVSDSVVLIDQERLLQSAAGLPVQSAFEAADAALLQAGRCVVELAPSAGVAVTDARTALEVDSLEALRSPSRHTFFGAGRAPLRAGGDAATAVSVATAVSAAVHDAMSSPFLGPRTLAAAQQVVCVLGLDESTLASWEKEAQDAAAETVATLVGSGCRTTLIAVSRVDGSAEVSARLLVSAVQPAGSGASPSLAAVNTAASVGASAEDARTPPSWRHEAMSKLAGGSRLRNWEAAPKAAVPLPTTQQQEGPAASGAPARDGPAGAGRGEGSGLKRTTPLAAGGADGAPAARLDASQARDASSDAELASLAASAAPSAPAPSAAGAGAPANAATPAPSQVLQPLRSVSADDSGAPSAAGVSAAADAPVLIPPRRAAEEAEPPPVLDDILRGDFAQAAMDGDGAAGGDWDDEEDKQRGGGLPLLGWFRRKRPASSLRAAVRSRTARLLASDRAATRSVARMEFADGTVYEGEVSASGQMEGKGRIVYLNGNWYAGEWRAGRRHGWGMSYVSGVKVEGRWENGSPQQSPPS